MCIYQFCRAKSKTQDKISAKDVYEFTDEVFYVEAFHAQKVIFTEKVVYSNRNSVYRWMAVIWTGISTFLDSINSQACVIAFFVRVIARWEQANLQVQTLYTHLCVIDLYTC